MARILVTSRPYLFVPIWGPGGKQSSGTVDLALVSEAAGEEPGSSDWHVATWMAPDPNSPADLEASLLIGPGGGQEYAAGRYMCYARLTAGAEEVVLESGRVTIG